MDLSTNELKKVTIRECEDEFHLECRFKDGQKFAAVTVDINCETLATEICNFLNVKAIGEGE
jgi:hypothetical protein